MVETTWFLLTPGGVKVVTTTTLWSTSRFSYTRGLGWARSQLTPGVVRASRVPQADGRAAAQRLQHQSHNPEARPGPARTFPAQVQVNAPPKTGLLQPPPAWRLCCVDVDARGLLG